MVIDLHIAEEALQFQERWNRELPLRSPLRLDNSWPSIGALDLILSRYRAGTQPSAGDPLLRGAAAYLGGIVAQCWLRLDPRTRVYDSGEGVTICCYGAPVSRGLFEVRLEKMLYQLYRSGSHVVSVVPNFSRTVGPDQSLLSPVALGLCLGMTVYGEPHEPRELNAGWGDYPQGPIAVLAESCAGWYSRVYPHEPIGQAAQLYQSHLLFPPMMMAEASHAQRAAQGLMAYARSWSLSPEEMLQLCRNLILCPDELISHAALIVYTGLSEHLAPPEIVCAAHAKGKVLGLMRRTMLTVRAGLDLPGDWMMAARFGADEERRFEIERSLGFLPWIYMDAAVVGDLAQGGSLRELIVALSEAELDYAKALLERELRRTPHDLAIRLQKCYLDLQLLDLNGAESLLARIDEPQKGSDAVRYHELRAVCALLRNDMAVSAQHFRIAFALCRRPDALRQGIAAQYGSVLLRTGQYAKALNVLNIGLQGCASPVWMLLQKSILCLGFQMERDQEEIERKLLQLAPLDRRVALMYCERLFPQGCSPQGNNPQENNTATLEELTLPRRGSASGHGPHEAADGAQAAAVGSA